MNSPVVQAVDPMYQRRNLVTPLTERARKVIENHIRNAVLIDDDWPSLLQKKTISEDLLAEDSELESEEESESEENGASDDPSTFSSSLGPAKPKINDIDNQNRLLKIQDTFIKRGIICTGFKYTKEDKDSAPRLAKNADIVVLDWNFAGDGGVGATEILRELKDERLRFICIFTDQDDLVQIKRTIWDKVCALSGAPDDNLDFKIENFVFTLRNKKISGSQSENISEEESLFDHAIHGLSLHYNGLLQLGMLELTSRHRDNMLSHLSRYSPEFDAALLSEAVQLGSPVGVAENLRALLVDEWRIALEQSAQNSEMAALGNDALTEYARGLKDQLPKITAKFLRNCFQALEIPYNAPALEKWFKSENGQTPAYVDLLGRWLDGGARDVPPGPADWPKKPAGLATKVTVAYLYALSHPEKVDDIPTCEDIYSDVFRLDALFNQQQLLPADIGQGTILKEDGGSYFICITPLCDTARLKAGFNSYTFLGASKATVSKPLESSPNYCVFVENENPTCLHVDVKWPYVFEIEKGAAEQISINKLVPIRPRFPSSGKKIQYAAASDSVVNKDLIVAGSTIGANTSSEKNKNGAGLKNQEVVMAVSLPASESSPPEINVNVNPANDMSISTAISQKENGEPVEVFATSVNLKVVGQLRTDFFLMLTAAAASNAGRVGVNRVEFIRYHKDKKS